ncbi:hypothetical protein [Streptomyces mobaraensis]|uniref:Uncharacterized protein n=1 Tax=Streptomyces mobaraensis TaxID=35621 RepID=A0A5N5W121_STRMB|nr:hypothetical protein [Streptomyces mobaraensis]KAB7835484.1 hypothetical protein FRZ00_26665 [Streptomyces mobaraensis]
MSIASLLFTLSGVLASSTGYASYAAGNTAFAGWLWWESGGGDDTKRRLRRWAGRFQGARCTAREVTS